MAQVNSKHLFNWIRRIPRRDMSHCRHELVLNAADSQGIVADNLIFTADDIGTACARCFIFDRPPSQPIVQDRLPAGEQGCIVREGQRSRR